jgi:hypothetical protein
MPQKVDDTHAAGQISWEDMKVLMIESGPALSALRVFFSGPLCLLKKLSRELKRVRA